MKKVLIALITAGLLLVGATGVLAATFSSPAEIYAGLKGITVEDAYTARAAGSTFGQLADQAGVLDQFQSQMLENRKALIQDRVTNGTLTQAQADAMIQTLEQNMALCDGTGMYGQGMRGAMGQGMKGAMGQGMRGSMGQGMRGTGGGFAQGGFAQQQ